MLLLVEVRFMLERDNLTRRPSTSSSQCVRPRVWRARPAVIGQESISEGVQRSSLLGEVARTDLRWGSGRGGVRGQVGRSWRGVKRVR